MRFIKLKLLGGLGNQLFQYATVRALIKKNDQLLFDTHSYKNDHYNRYFTLNHYQVKGKELNKSKLERFFNPYSKVNYLLKNIGLYNSILENGFYVHKNLKSEMRLFTSFKGYWQSYTYFDNLKEILQQEIKPKQLPEIPEYIQHDQSVVIHIRRTDYANDSRYGCLDKAYYFEAINKIKSLVKNPSFVFFSDDIAWCKQNFQERNSSFCENLPDYIRLYLMSLCKHHIISNSSFAWWGAWLCASSNQVVIRPERPFNDTSLLYEHYYPENWISIANN